MVRNDFTFHSASGLCDIAAQSFRPEGDAAIKGVVQITHGMAEHKERYEWFAGQLTDAGWAVYIMDLLGHGASVKDDSELGYFGEHGLASLLKDMKELNGIAHAECPGVPYVMFGHSMGSFLTRAYSAKYPATMTAAVYCGTSGPNPATGIGLMLAKRAAAKEGEKTPSPKLNGMAFGSYNKRTQNRTAFDWLSVNEENVDRYIADPYCGFVFTNNGFVTLMTLLKSVTSSGWYERVPKDLPIYLIAGTEDPVGNYGKGVGKVYRALKKTGHSSVSIQMYPGDRHEILNEDDRDRVVKDLLAWMDENT